MKEIKAFIRPSRVEDVLRALHEHPDFPGVTVSEVRGFGRIVGRDAGGSAEFGTVEMAKLECIVDDERAPEVVRLIQEHAGTGRPGDGKIAVHAVETLIRVRSGESGEHAM